MKQQLAHIMFTDKFGKFHSVLKPWPFVKIEAILKRINATYWEIG